MRETWLRTNENCRSCNPVITIGDYRITVRGLKITESTLYRKNARMPIYATTPLNQSRLFGPGFGSTSFSNIQVTAESGGLKVNTPYSATFVNELKLLIPATGRKWDASSKCWFVSRDYSDTLKQIIDRAYNCDVTMPTDIAPASEVFETTFQADYIANSKNEPSSVHTNGAWNAKIPETVLRKWFKQAADVNAPETLYSVLGLAQTATEKEIKSAYKRAARQWHPDVCREENAREMFEKTKDAYAVLSDHESRNRYNAGLMFEKMASLNMGRRHSSYQSKYSTFTPLLRCGILTVKAKRELGVLIVEEILDWKDIENEAGQIMVSFWAADTWGMAWV